MNEDRDQNVNEWPGRMKVAFVGLTAIASFFLLAEHRAHVLPYVPFLLLAACPLMHLFMHGRHGGHASSDAEDGSTNRQSSCVRSSDAGRPPRSHRHGDAS